ncbi:MAG: hypothetical protein K0R08_1055 [Solimicrobium sp.]|jgi:hypothetical protein|nr:hypothetical protein [Solimicrobium sp.]
MATLPIMLFNERALTPSFGYVFDPKWIYPYESLASILWKLVRMNRLPGHIVVTQLARDSSIDPYLGVGASQSDVDIGRIPQVLGVSLNTLHSSLLLDSLLQCSSPYFRYCRKCMYRGYHGVVHQLESIKFCPVHQCRLEIECDACGGHTPYRLNAYFLDAPYRCASCRKLYASWPPSIVNKRPLARKARVAMTRSWLHPSSYY